MNDHENIQTLAFEYVLGTLTKEEREEFESQLKINHQLEEEVRYWQSTLMPLSDGLPELEPAPQTFANIKKEINKTRSTSEESQAASFWEKLLPWKIATYSTFSLLLALAIFIVSPLSNRIDEPNADYVAVLVNEQNAPILTALTASDGSKLWLKWENWESSSAHSLQLWSQSRRDGEIRPLLIFDSNEVQELALDQATWRLIKDSSHLIITQEELGGSATDVPSDIVIAKGVCIRLATSSQES